MSSELWPPAPALPRAGGPKTLPSAVSCLGPALGQLQALGSPVYARISGTSQHSRPCLGPASWLRHDPAHPVPAFWRPCPSRASFLEPLLHGWSRGWAAPHRLFLGHSDVEHLFFVQQMCCLSGLLFLSPDGLKEQVSEEVFFPSQWRSQILGEAAWQEGKGAYLLIHLPSTWLSVCQTRSGGGVAFTLHLRKSFSNGKSSEVCYIWAG